MKKLLVILLIFPLNIICQKKINGTIVDKNEIFLSGVLVKVEGSKTEVLSDDNGFYSLTASKAGDLLFSKAGFSSQSVPYDETTYTINVTLNEAEEKIEPDRRTNSLRSAENFSGRDLIIVIAGKIPGARIKGGKIALRGRQSFKESDAVIWEVNGMIYNTPPPLDISQIRYLDVKKGLAETNIYGSQGGAGVIILKTEVTEKEYQSANNLWNKPPPLTKEEKRELKAKRKAKRLLKKMKKNSKSVNT
tara:strand:- start:1667 stop:2410 length:744 start_codon:yes stop_codon:yes gene_type:complete